MLTSTKRLEKFVRRPARITELLLDSKERQIDCCIIHRMLTKCFCKMKEPLGPPKV
jgi:hypothetical protein